MSRIFLAAVGVVALNHCRSGLARFGRVGHAAFNLLLRAFDLATRGMQ